MLVIHKIEYNEDVKKNVLVYSISTCNVIVDTQIVDLWCLHWIVSKEQKYRTWFYEISVNISLDFLIVISFDNTEKVEKRANKAWERKNAANSIWWWVFRAIIWEIKERGTKNDSSKTCSLSYIHGCFLR